MCTDGRMDGRKKGLSEIIACYCERACKVCVYYDTILVTCLKRTNLMNIMTGQYHKLRRFVAGFMSRWLGFDLSCGFYG
jgi:hypothetical protein